MRKEDSNNVFSNSIKLWWRGIDQQIILALVILFVFSMMLVTTSGSAVATRIGLDEHYFSFRQVFYLGAAAVTKMAQKGCNLRVYYKYNIINFGEILWI